MTLIQTVEQHQLKKIGKYRKLLWGVNEAQSNIAIFKEDCIVINTKPLERAKKKLVKFTKKNDAWLFRDIRVEIWEYQK